MLHVPAPFLQRAFGKARLVFKVDDDITRLADLYQEGAAKIRLPRAGAAAAEAILINSAGGLTGGDIFSLGIELAAGARAALSTQACEKIYRASEGKAAVSTELVLKEGACLDWLPQETILFDGARLQRRLGVELAESARFLMVEALVFGREAYGESVRTLFLNDRVEIRRDGRLIYADALCFQQEEDGIFQRRATGAGARAVATLVDAAPDSGARLEEARHLLASCRVEAGASAWNGVLAMRFVAASAAELRADLVRVLAAWRQAPLPRVWSL